MRSMGLMVGLVGPADLPVDFVGLALVGEEILVDLAGLIDLIAPDLVLDPAGDGKGADPRGTSFHLTFLRSY